MEVNDNTEKIKRGYTHEDIKKILNFVKMIKYGSITLVIQDGSIIQIETNEKIRIK